MNNPKRELVNKDENEEKKQKFTKSKIKLKSKLSY